MADHETTRKLAAILSADVVGYSRLMGDDDDATVQTLSAYREVFQAQIARHGGRLVDTAGDSVLAEFPSVAEAVQCAVAVQAALHDQNAALPEHRRMQFRIGINLGDVLAKDDGTIYGDGVNIAARLESLADPGGLCISEAVRSAVGTKLPVAYAFLGERAVKNIAEPVRAYRVEVGGASEHAPLTCPYPGMVPFSAADASYFYGRDDEVQRMVQLLRRQRFVMVIGPSGSGKSSLVYAGLLPALEKSRYFTQGYWLIRTMRPGPRPSDVLAGVLDADGERGAFELDTVDAPLKVHPPAERLLLLVDQFEEVFTQADREERARFIAELQALRAPSNCALILTLRADFYPDLMTSYLWPVDARERVEVAPLRGETLRAAIERPAADVGVRIEESLVTQLLADAADEPGVLPLLQETMGLLWDEMEQRTLSSRAYQQLSEHAGFDESGVLSGLAVAMAMKADTTLMELSAAQQAIARRIFLRLIQFGEGRADTRRQQPVNALRAATDQPDELDRTLEHLTDHRLLTRSGDGEQHPSTVDISHESLIGGWSRLQDWADERREAEQIRRRLEGKAAEWVRLGKGGGGQLSDVELSEAERWLASADAADLGFDATLPELVNASQQAIEAAEQAREAAREQELRQAEALAEEQRQRIAEQSRATEEQRQRIEEQGHAARRMRRAMMGLAAVFLIAVRAAFFAWTQRQKAQSFAVQEAAAREEAEARRTESETRRVEAEHARLASIAQLLLIQAPQQQAVLADERGALLARQAYHFSAAGGRRLQEQVDSVLRTVAGKPHFSRVVRRAHTPSIAFSPDGTKLASIHQEPYEVVLWDLTQPGAPPVVLPGYPGDRALYPLALAFSPDGKTLIAANADGAIGQWRLDNSQAPLIELPRQQGGVWSAAFSPDGRWLATGSKLDDSFAVWDLAQSDAEPVPVSDPQPAPAGSGPLFLKLGGVPVAFSPDSTTLATGSLNGMIRLWRLDDLTAPVTSLRGHEGGLLALTFYDQGRHLASGGQDKTIRLWDLESPSVAPVVLENGSTPAASLAIDPDGGILASSSTGGIRLWQVDALDVPPVVLPPGFIFQVALSPDGRRLASAGGGSEYLRLWDLGPSGRPLVLAGHQRAVLSLAFSADGKLLASGGSSGDNTIRLWRWDELGAPPVVLRGFQGEVNSLDFSGDGNGLLSASWDDNSVRLWDLGESTPTFIALPMPDALQPWTALFSPGGRTVVATGTGGVHVWDIADLHAEAEVLLPTEHWASGMAFSPSGNTLATASSGPALYVKDLTRSERSVSKLLGHGELGGFTLAFSPDGKILASGGKDATVRLWDPTAPEKSSIVLGRHNHNVTRVRFSPDGKQLASASADRSVRLWNVENPDALPIVLSGHEDQVWSLAYSPDGKHLATGSLDKSIRIWDLMHPLNASTTQQVADMVCEKVWRNLTLDEWHTFVGADIPYERTCANRPIHPSLFEAAEKRAKAGDKAGAGALLERAVALDPSLDLDPHAEAARLAPSAAQ